MYLQQICSQVRDICKEVGAFMKEENVKIKASDIDKKGLNDFVTYVDKTAEKMLVERLKKIIIDAGFITEEKTIEQSDEEYVWIIDPLDGTTNYIHGLSPYAISIGLKRDEEMILGVVYVIESNEMFYAWKEGGAWLNGYPIHVSDSKKLSDSLLATGFPYSDFSDMKAYINLFEYLMQNSHGLRRLGSAATDLVYVACGRMDAFYEYGLSSWDVAAGAFIVKEAGGKVNDFWGGEDWLFGKTLVSGTVEVTDELTQLTKHYFKKE